MTWLDKIGLGHRNHCEKTSFVTAFGIIAFIISVILFYYKGYTVAQNFIWLFGLSALAGMLGVIGYRAEKHKPIFPKW